MTHDECLMAVLEAGGIPNGTYYLLDDQAINNLLKKAASYHLEPLQTSELWEMWVNTSNHVQYARLIEREHGIE